MDDHKESCSTHALLLSGTRRSRLKHLAIPSREGSELALAEFAGTFIRERLGSASSDWRPEQYAEIGARQGEIKPLLEALYGEWQTAVKESDESTKGLEGSR